MPIRTLFMGSPQEVVPVLEALVKNEEIQVIGVVTQPDRPVGRKKVMTPTPVKVCARTHDIPVLEPLEFDDRFYRELENKLIANSVKRIVTTENSQVTNFETNLTNNLKLKTNNYPDLAIVAAYGQILPYRLLQTTKYGFLNLHPSLLPQYRGTSPTVGAILNGEKVTGLTVIKMDEAMDHGPVLAQFEERLKADDTLQSLTERLFVRGAEILPEVVKNYINFQQLRAKSEELKATSKNLKLANFSDLLPATSYQLYLPPQEQDHTQATFTQLLTRDDGLVPWELVQAAMTGQVKAGAWPSQLSKRLQKMLSSETTNTDWPIVLERLVRALWPWPGVWTTVKLKMKNEKLKNKEQRLKIITTHLESGKLVLDQVRPEGKATMNWQET